MPITVDHKDGWLFPGPLSNKIHDITAADLSMLLTMAEEEDHWADRVKQEVFDRDQSLRDGTWKDRPPIDWLIEEFRIMNVAGTVIHFPYGPRIITFPSKRHLFRGENRQYTATVPSLNRTIDQVEDPREKELYRVVAYLRNSHAPRRDSTINETREGRECGRIKSTVKVDDLLGK